MALTQEEESFWRLCRIVLDIIPKNLRTYFKLQWDLKYPQNIWQDSPGNGQHLIGQIPKKILTRFSYLKSSLSAGDSNNWDPTALLFVFSNVAIVNQNERNELEKLRKIRNDCFHSKSAAMKPQDLLKKITDIQNAFGILGFQSGLLEIATIQNAPIETQLSLQLQRQLDQERQLNDHYTKDLADRMNTLEENVEVIQKRLKTVEENQKPDQGACEPSVEMATEVKGACEPSIVTAPEVKGACKLSIVTAPEVKVASQSSTDLAPELEDASQRLKNGYRDTCSKHVITVVSEDGKRIDREEMDIGDFAVEVNSGSGSTIFEDTKNERINFINQTEFNRLYCVNHYKMPLLYENGLPHPKIILITGVAGIGKTVLSKQIAFQWANHEIYTDFAFLFLIEGRDLCDSKLNLDDFLEERSFHEDMDAKDILFIIDGLDLIEDLRDQLTDVHSKLSQLLGISSYIFHESSFILTGRPHVEEIITDKFCNTLCVLLHPFRRPDLHKVSGLSEDTIDRYITMFAKEDPIKIEQIKKTRASSQNIKFASMVPQYLNTLCCMSLMTGGMEIKNFTELYTWLIYIILKDLSNGDGNDEINADEIFHKFAKLVTKLAEVAFKLFEKEKITFTREEFESIFIEIESDKVMAEGFRAFCHHKDDGFELQQTFWFLHFTMQEYFASLFCYVNEIAPGDLIKNNNFEILNFLSGLHGCTIKNECENEESIVNILVRECLESKEKQEEKSWSFMLNLLDAFKASKADVDDILLLRGIIYLREHLDSRFKYTDENHLEKVISKLINIPSQNGNGLNAFNFSSALNQRNLHSLLEIAETNNLLEKFRNVKLSLPFFSYFPLCKYFRYFGFVDLCVYSNQSAAELKLLFDVLLLYCNEVQLVSCIISEGCFDSNGSKEDFSGDIDTLRVESLHINRCEIDEIYWENIIRLISKIEKVTLWGMEMKRKQWKKLVDIIVQEKRDSRLRLTEMKFNYCNIDLVMIEKIKEAGVSIVW